MATRSADLVRIEALLGGLRDGSIDPLDAARDIADWVAGNATRLDAVKQLLQRALAEQQLAQSHHRLLLAALQGLTLLREPAPGGVREAAGVTAIRSRAPAAAQADPAAPRPELRPGSSVRGRYVLLEMIGSGGMGQVWKATDSYLERTNDPDPWVAIKMLNADLEQDPDGYVALQRETKKAQELAHPNVVTVHSFDTDTPGSGRAFMSMELLEGEGLDARIRRHPGGDARDEALPIILGMTRGLEYAHERGIVHADFKPGNVFVTAAGVPKILDFGIARAAKVAGANRRADSFDAGTFGGITPRYASLDMIERREPHPADDVYALGLVTYELLAGVHPFKGMSALEARDARLLPPRPRAARRHEWRALERALAFDRDRRWQNAGEFLRAFEGRSVTAGILGAVAAVLLVTVGGLWYENWKAQQPAVPFDSLSPAQQAQFARDMTEADQGFQLLDVPGGTNPTEIATAYCNAYAIHPRNPQAVQGLVRVAQYALPKFLASSDRAGRRVNLQNLRRTCEVFYAHYEPLSSALGNDAG